MLNFLSGYRTYLVGAGLIITGIVKWIDGDPDALTIILEGLGAITMRTGISKATKGQS